ncbi:LysR family transcriptional regulator [Vibrio mediterranei]|uniref:LysR family transcriptional regulator n=1 Tax=Vibrio mediterranei TaxID=689 RepID=UPI00148DD3CA|nr:LysR family transcriptional regulator [Vibrio mediterranei]NOH31332.1 LysR family transcriptional regulator [Vibrio mediterranei]
MSKFNVLNVDGKLLSIFCAVYEEGSISKGAARLGLSQPVVSHSLERLRLALNDPLFVRAGRTITPTERAKVLAPEISELVDRLVNLAEPHTHTIKEIDTHFCLSANDFERQLIAPKLSKELWQLAPKAGLKLISANESFIEDLRSRKCDLVVTPLNLPNHLDIHYTPLFEDNSMFFFDPSVIGAEEVLSNYARLEHAVVRFGANKTQIADSVFENLGIIRNVKLESPSFEALPIMMKGTPLIATLPSKLKQGLFSEFDCISLPFEFPTVKFKMVWHKATHTSPTHKWFRSIVRTSISNN